MIDSSVNKLPVLQFQNLSAFPEVHHFTTTRNGGISKDIYSSFNLGLHSGENSAEVMQNRNILCNFYGIGLSQLILPKQTHSCNVKCINDTYLSLSEEEKKEYLGETDALITEIEGLMIAVKTADCVPVLLYDHKRKIIAAIHAGWRGTIQGITSHTIKKMISELNSDPKNIFAGIGPSISPSVYQVGKEVWEQFNTSFYEPDGEDRQKRFLNLWKANVTQLIENGIPEENIELAELCTFSNPTLFYSARRDGIKTGRMATGIMLRI